MLLCQRIRSWKYSNIYLHINNSEIGYQQEICFDPGYITGGGGGGAEWGGAGWWWRKLARGYPVLAGIIRQDKDKTGRG